VKAILTYHSIDASGSVVSVHPDRFREHVELLARQNVPVLSLDELLSPSCARGVAITFDDGFENLASVAWPILSAHGFPSVVFVVTDRVGADNAWGPGDSGVPVLPLMDWTTLARLSSEGLAVESHGRTHARLTTLSDIQLFDELAASREAIRERVGRRPSVFAYPYGDCDDRVARAVESAGYRCALTTELRELEAEEPNPFRLPRLDAYYLAKPGIMERWDTAALQRYLRFRNGARRLRARLKALAK